MSSPEQYTGPEGGPEALKDNAEHYERLEKNLENKENKAENHEAKAEHARVEALEKAVSTEKGGAEKDRRPAQKAPRRRGAISKHEKKASFDRRMKHVQGEMSPVQRAFSKAIHNPVVEKTSEVVGSTIARPNAILAGSVAAFVLVLGVYVVAKTFGYPLSGFETIGAFIVGWLLGTLYDFFRIMITGKKS